MKTKKLLILTQNQNNMKRLFLITAILICYSLANAQNPFEAYGYTPKIATLSQGKYNEFHDLDTIVQIGTVLFNTKSKQIVAFLQTDTLYSEATLQPDIVSMWMSPDPLSDEYPSNSPYMFCLGNPIVFIDPDGRYVDWYLNLKSGQVEHHDGSDNLFDQGLVHLAPDNASVGDIQDALSQRNYSYQKDANVQGGFRVDTKKQYKGWATMQYCDPEIFGTILFMSLGIGGTIEQVGKTAVRAAVTNVTMGGRTAFDIAKAGGKHAGFFKNYIGRSPAEINKAINSLQTGNRGINVHLDKIANPSKYVKNWDALNPSHQQSLIRGWQKEINNSTEQIQILKGILGQ